MAPKKAVNEEKKNVETTSQLPTVTKDDIYTEELNNHLLCQINLLNKENEDLQARINEKDSHNNKLSQTIQSLKEDIKNLVSTSGPSISAKSSGIIGSKITELCKQNRHLVAEVESYKTKCSQLERQVLEKEIENANGKEQAQSNKDKDKEEETSLDLDELKELRDKLIVTTKKLMEMKNKNLDLKNELLIANKCLQCEIGPSFTTIQKLASDPVGYKGRAQEIIILRNKLVDLEEKYYGKSKIVTMNQKRQNTNNQVIKDIEAKRRNQNDMMTKELCTIQIECTDLRKKLEGAMARIKILNCEGGQLRQNVQTLTEKSEYDEKLKKELLEQQKATEKQYKNLLKENNENVEKIKISHSHISQDLEVEKFRVNALMDRINAKDKKIEHLKEQLSKLVESSIQKVYFTPLQIAADNEIKVLSELLSKANKSLEEERRKCLEWEKRYLKLKEYKVTLQKKNDSDSKVSKSKSSSLVQASRSVSSTNVVDSSNGNLCCPDGCRRSEILRLSSKLEVAQEHAKCLELRLKIVEDERAADIEAIDQMIVDSKKIFADALKNFQENR